NLFQSPPSFPHPLAKTIAAAPAPAPWPASTPASTTRSPRVTTPPRPQVAPSTSPHPHPASWIRVAPSASGYLDPRRPIHIRLPRYFVADRFFGGSRRCAGVAEVPTFTQASESHQRRITEAILEHALKICSDKNVVGLLKVVVGDPKEKICEVAAELKADLLV
uniref:UspA domain-containing protein n=1 Tax=Aegilops tauschii subsp. strangulata TaxID=200361 RepID=A0A453RNA1_AEGTS